MSEICNTESNSTFLSVEEAKRQFERTDWTENIACRGQDPEIFFIEGKHARGSAAYRKAVAKARSFCDVCPSREPCLEYGMSQPEGIYGGMTIAQRRALKGKHFTIVDGIRE